MERKEGRTNEPQVHGRTASSLALCTVTRPVRFFVHYRLTKGILKVVVSNMETSFRDISRKIPLWRHMLMTEVAAAPESQMDVANIHMLGLPENSVAWGGSC